MLSTARTRSRLGDKIYYCVIWLAMTMIVLGLLGKAALFIMKS